ncbi:SIR2 family NAD-dependent protein deacylase [Sinimarinibacterium flocculans]|uniref:protein acetyllysine N-acetyltransferase n=1 Tax=Sinimarinibacterium flocculans TaxID=985250 RepID=A0A318EAK1_9GAMM|nr:Sir2 family NAD-dependent protein deacetylase [Sinimarinibacterium flocculans]PXV69501.1 NAD-dependent deacetylase [Sinimarinibacterium flocculans]
MIALSDYARVVVFTGAGMSAESGVPTYRGRGGIWQQYDYEDYACESAFRRHPQRVLDFHELRREQVLGCEPHAGHAHLASLQRTHPSLSIVTQNIDGMHQRAGGAVAAELHGSLWRLRCAQHGVVEDAAAGRFVRRDCTQCGRPLRPDITWFGDMIDEAVFAQARALIEMCSLFVCIGTSAVVWPAAGLIPFDVRQRPHLVEINPEPTDGSARFDRVLRASASALPELLVP